MANNKNLVSAAKPAVAGGIYVAPLTATLPTDATSELGDEYICLGYVSDSGVSNARGVDEEVKAWGGDVVIQTKTDTFKMTLIEGMNVEVLKTVFGEENVTGTLETGIVVKSNDAVADSRVVVIDMMLRDALKRVVLPRGQVTEVGDTAYTDGDVIGYEVTITAHQDANGVAHYEYIKENKGA